MPPLEPLEPPTGDVVPYPGEILTLSGDRWLTQGAEVVRRPHGVPVDVLDNTRAYWEGRAAKAGYTLDQLLG